MAKPQGHSEAITFVGALTLESRIAPRVLDGPIQQRGFRGLCRREARGDVADQDLSGPAAGGRPGRMERREQDRDQPQQQRQTPDQARISRAEIHLTTDRNLFGQTEPALRGVLDRHLAGREYILEGGRSVIDAYLLPTVRWARKLLAGGLEGDPNVQSLHDRLAADPSVQKVLACEAGG